jgi:hypothetical protein
MNAAYAFRNVDDVPSVMHVPLQKSSKHKRGSFALTCRSSPLDVITYSEGQDGANVSSQADFARLVTRASLATHYAHLPVR